MSAAQLSQRGFTLIELAVVLVIIGLIVGGVLVGRELIAASAVRAQLTQIEKFGAAANTFRVKYEYLPGDISASAVTQLGFTGVPSRAGSNGRGDGDGLMEGYIYTGSSANASLSSAENAWFWIDLTVNSSLIEGRFNTATDAALTTNDSLRFIPRGKISEPSRVYVYSYNSVNYFGLSNAINVDANGALNNSAFVDHASPGLTVQQAASMDAKIDDGLPQTGRVLARYQDWVVNTGIAYAAGGGVQGATGTGATPGSATTCYDNDNTAGAAQQYSLTQNGGRGNNCALSFRLP